LSFGFNLFPFSLALSLCLCSEGFAQEPVSQYSAFSVKKEKEEEEEEEEETGFSATIWYATL
jgi:hypothetical protein